MSRRKKILLGVVATIAALLAGAVGYLFLAFPKSTPLDANLKIEPNDARRTRGEYLAVHVLSCVDCHSERDWGRFSGPIVAGTEGKGGEKFGRQFGFPGDIHAPNITPGKLSSWSDAEVVRAITEGVSKDGRALFPVMPYPSYSKLCREDLEAVVTHIRGLAPVENTPPPTDLDFPMSLIVRTIPAPSDALHRDCPDRSDRVAYGQYLTTVASCRDCHTPAEKGKPLPGLELAGGFEFPMPSGGKVLSANITPDKETGIGKWSERDFIQRFKNMKGPAASVEKGDFNTVMPWTLYAGMTDEDLGAIYTYLSTVPSVTHKVERFK